MTKSCKAIIWDALSIPISSDWLESNLGVGYNDFSIELLEERNLLIEYVEILLDFKEGIYAGACSDLRLRYYNQVKSLKSFLNNNQEAK